MRWYLLKDRRHEGPYTKEEIVEALRAGRIDPKDYLLPEIAIQDQSSFAYISAGDVAGPEVVFDLKKQKENTFVPRSPTPQSTASKIIQEAKHEKKMEELKSEFDEGIESTQLIHMKSIQSKNLSAGAGGGAALSPSFISQSSDASGLIPWKLVAPVAVLVLFVAMYFGVMGGDAVEKNLASTTPALKTPVTSVGGDTLAPKKALSRERTPRNRPSSNNLQLPAVTGRPDREDEPINSAFQEEEAVEEAPVRNRRGGRRQNKRTREALEDRDLRDEEDTLREEDSFDDRDYVDEDEVMEEDLDEADI